MKTTGFKFLLILTFFSTVLAQTEKGRWQVGAQVGNLTYQKYQEDAGHSMSVDLTPSAGYFIAKNLLVGMAVPFSGTSNELTFSSLGSRSRTIGVGPFIRYYVGNSVVKPFAGISYTYNNTLTRYDQMFNIEEVKLKGSSTNLAPTVGVAWFINRNVLLSAGLAYNFYDSKSEYVQQPTSSNPNPAIFQLESEYRNLSLGIGFALLFGK